MVGQFTGQCVTPLADNALAKVLLQRGAPESITVNIGIEFTSKALDVWGL